MNKFKVGDWVHCYLICPRSMKISRYALQIEKIIFNDHILLLTNNMGHGNVAAHYKMCRKLKKVPIQSYLQQFEDNGHWGAKLYA